MKTAKFRKVEMTVSRARGYGSYVITANYRGKDISVHTHDSELFDYIDDDSNLEKHKWARRKAYYLIKSMYDSYSN